MTLTHAEARSVIFTNKHTTIWNGRLNYLMSSLAQIFHHLGTARRAQYQCSKYDADKADVISWSLFRYDTPLINILPHFSCAAIMPITAISTLRIFLMDADIIALRRHEAALSILIISLSINIAGRLQSAYYYVQRPGLGYASFATWFTMSRFMSACNRRGTSSRASNLSARCISLRQCYRLVGGESDAHSYFLPNNTSPHFGNYFILWKSKLEIISNWALCINTINFFVSLCFSSRSTVSINWKQIYKCLKLFSSDVGIALIFSYQTV